MVPGNGDLVLAATGHRAPSRARYVHSQLKSLILEAEFPCPGARSAFHRSTYAFGLYPHMAGASATDRLARDLRAFIALQPTLPGNFTTFLASFESPTPATEAEFHALLWDQIQALHDEDDAVWDPGVSSDPADPQFSYSFGGRAFFLVGLHPASSRWSRRFTWPTIVFNAHYQFEALRDQGAFERFQAVVRTRDVTLQGDVNPTLTDYGEDSEARQYSGLRVPADWKCPLHVTPR